MFPASAVIVKAWAVASSNMGLKSNCKDEFAPIETGPIKAAAPLKVKDKAPAVLFAIVKCLILIFFPAVPARIVSVPLASADVQFLMNPCFAWGLVMVIAIF